VHRLQPLADAAAGRDDRAARRLLHGIGAGAGAAHAEGVRRGTDHEQVQLGGDLVRRQAHLGHLDLDVLAETGRHCLCDLLGVAEHRLVHHECLHRPSSERCVAVW
jgi:hypothetical protein